MAEGKIRESGIELLRIFASFAVIILHYNNANYGGAIAYVSDGTINYYILYLFENVSIVAVNVFILISGYFLCESKQRSFAKPIQLLIQVVIFGGCIYLAGVLFGDGLFSGTNFVISLVPNNYYVILYVVLYAIFPYLNILIRKLSKDELKPLVLLCFSLFAIWPTAVDVIQVVTGTTFYGLSSIGLLGSQNGYTIINFVLLYFLGSYLRIEKPEEKYSTQKIIAGWILCLAIMMTWSLFSSETAWEYCNPILILEAVFTFMIFQKIHFASKIINRLAKASFTCYLIHMTFIRNIGIEWAVTSSAWILILHMVVVVVILYLVAWIVDEVYRFVTEPIYRKLFSKKTLGGKQKVF